MAKRYWLMKSEPTTFSLADLKAAPKSTTLWDGVRNYQARNFMRDGMKSGDGVLFYHSVTDPIGIAGLAEVAKEAYPDPSQFDPRSKYYDEKATRQDPRWFVVDIKYVRTFDEVLGLDELRKIPALKNMMVLKKGSRLSVQPVTESEWKAILAKKS